MCVIDVMYVYEGARICNTHNRTPERQGQEKEAHNSKLQYHNLAQDTRDEKFRPQAAALREPALVPLHVANTLKVSRAHRRHRVSVKAKMRSAARDADAARLYPHDLRLRCMRAERQVHRKPAAPPEHREASCRAGDM